MKHVKNPVMSKINPSPSYMSRRQYKPRARKGEVKKSLPVAVPGVLWSPQAIEILRLMEETRRHIFLTGRAGTGKSTLLQHFQATTKKNIVVLAPTGVAAVNVKGQTVHSFFSFGPGITPDGVKRVYGSKAQLYKKLQAVIIDEVSMVRADLLDCVDAFLRLNGPESHLPFGGVQMIFIGDLYQLPPVVTRDDRDLFDHHYASPYFFDAKAFKKIEVQAVELSQVHRQKEQEFIRLLDAVRTCSATDEHLKLFNARFDSEFDADEADFYVYLTPTKQAADHFNARKLAIVESPLFESEGLRTGDFSESYIPTAQHLAFKEGAQVMLLNNDQAHRWVNGDIGRVVAIEQSGNGQAIIQVQLYDGRIENVSRYQWEMIRFFYNEHEARVESQVVGTFTQYPLRLAWAVTIHKSQGKTFEKVIIDFGRGTFAHGQAYVALSRATSLEGLVLKSPLQHRHIFIDERVSEFLQSLKSGLSFA